MSVEVTTRRRIVIEWLEGAFIGTKDVEEGRYVLDRAAATQLLERLRSYGEDCSHACRAVRIDLAEVLRSPGFECVEIRVSAGEELTTKNAAERGGEVLQKAAKDAKGGDETTSVGAQGKTDKNSIRSANGGYQGKAQRL